MKRTHLIVLMIAVAISGCSTYKVAPVKNGQTLPGNVITYYLPQKQYDVQLAIKVTTKTPSDYVASDPNADKKVFAALGYNDVILAKSVKVVLNSASLISRAVPDSNQCYAITLPARGRAFSNDQFAFNLTENGFLTGASITQNNYLFEALGNIAATAAEIGVSAMRNDDAANAGKTPLDVLLDKIVGVRKMREAILNDKYSEYSAERLKDLIEEEGRLMTLLSGDITVKEYTPTLPYDISIKPQSGVKTPFCKLIKAFPYFTTTDISTNEDNVIYITMDQTNKTPATANSIQTARNGLYYRIPATCLFTIWQDKLIIKRQVETVPQFGSVAQLPNGIISLKKSLDISIDPATGALLKVDMKIQGISPALVADAGAAAVDLTGKIKDRDLDKLTRQVDLLTKQKELLDAQKALKEAQEIQK